MLLAPDKNEDFRGLLTLEGLRGIALTILTTSEIIVLDSANWKILIRQKHRRDLDPSLIMKSFSAEDGTGFDNMTNFSN
jgi:hypothetical protein